tara:strand:- start:114 stop:413 length:300 start_codon:yes stop_codon:yes gene_type:complete
MKDSESKLVDIKQYNEILHQYVLDKKIKLQDAYNLARSGIEMVSEYKGRGTRSKNLPTLDKEIETIMKSHKPSLDDLLDSIKKQFVFTWDKSIKDYLEK